MPAAPEPGRRAAPISATDGAVGDGSGTHAADLSTRTSHAQAHQYQAVLLAHAAQNSTGSVYPLPESHARGGVQVAKALAQLLAAGLAEECEGVPPEQTTREYGDLRFGLFVTLAGLSAIGIELEPEEATVAPAQSASRWQPKIAAAIALLQRAEGATTSELITATGWLPHTTRAALTGRRKKCHAITTGKRDRATGYTLGVA